MSRTTVTNFFNGVPVRENEFRKICLTLRLNWQVASSVQAFTHSEASIDHSSDVPQTDHTHIQLVASKALISSGLSQPNQQHVQRRRSRKLSSAGKEQVERALTDKQWSVENLASKADLSIPTAKSFRAGKAVDRRNFVRFCEVLGLDWEVVSGEPIVSPEIPIGFPTTSLQPDDTLLQQIRERCRQKILNQHSRIRLLSGEEIGVDQLYVDVWLLNRSPHTFQVSASKLLETFDLRNDRLGLGDRIRRDPGFEVANANLKLVILGKPGSGKTTFLKHLAADWCKGEFQPDSIAVLIELRRIRDRKWNLIEAIDQELGLGNWFQFQQIQKQIKTLEHQHQQENQIRGLQQQLEALPLQKLLKRGKLLVLMDGLDEVPTSELRREVQAQLQQLAVGYPNNRLVLTCRTQIIESILVGFTSVEVADFREEQVEWFVQNWFTASGQSSAIAARQWKTFEHAINHNPALKELTTTPVLLSLMCLVLQDSGGIPSQRNWLYQKGIKLLLNRWNDAKQIDDWEVGSEAYRQLSVEQKEALLTEIAACKFENPENFVLFQQDEIATQITQFLQLANFKEGVAVLKAIEAQHGLLIERADELWSFSHRTFQEYFILKWLTQFPSEQLVEKIANKQGQEVIKQVVKSQQQPADCLLQLIKQAIDQSIHKEPKLQEFLNWVFQKSESVQANYQKITIRAFYFDSALDHTLDPFLLRSFDFDTSHALGFDFDPAHAFDLVLDRALIDVLTFERLRAFNLGRDLTDLVDLGHALNLALDLDSELADQLKQLQAKLPTLSEENWEKCEESWLENWTQWRKQLREVMIKYRNIGRAWKFTDVETQQIQRYYEANKFLVELMQIEGAVSNDVRAEIEDSLLLSWEELQRRQS